MRYLCGMSMNVHIKMKVLVCETDEEDAGGEGNGQCRFKLNGDYALNCVEDFGKINMSDLSSQNIIDHSDL